MARVLQSLRINTLAAGLHSLTASYAGDGKFDGARLWQVSINIANPDFSLGCGSYDRYRDCRPIDSIHADSYSSGGLREQRHFLLLFRYRRHLPASPRR